MPLDCNLYDFPAYYDLVFGSDWKAEFDFLEDCFEKHVSSEVRRLFEPACGTGRLLYRLAKAGYEVSGLDLNTKAVDYCNRRLERHGFPPTAFVADMTRFRLPRKVDAAFNTINSFRHLSTEQGAVDHLRAVADCLRVGGIYLLGLHLTPTAGEAIEDECWSARRGHLCVNTRMWLIERDAAARTETYGMTYDVHTPTKHLQLFDKIPFRMYTATHFEQLIRNVPMLEIVAAYDFRYNTQRPIEVDETTEDVVFVLKRRRRASR